MAFVRVAYTLPLNHGSAGALPDVDCLNTFIAGRGPRSRRFVISGVAVRKDEHCEHSFLLYSVSPVERETG
jgi:hypothetical protein